MGRVNQLWQDKRDELFYELDRSAFTREEVIKILMKKLHIDEEEADLLADAVITSQTDNGK